MFQNSCVNLKPFKDEFSCQTFDGENQSVIDAKTAYPHDWASMAVYNDKMWVVGGCDPGEFECTNKVESYDGTSWQLGTDHPTPELKGHLVMAESHGLYVRVKKVS